MMIPKTAEVRNEKMLDMSEIPLRGLGIMFHNIIYIELEGSTHNPQLETWTL